MNWAILSHGATGLHDDQVPKEAWTNLSTSWVLGLDPLSTDKFRPRHAQAFTNLFSYLTIYLRPSFKTFRITANAV